MCNIARIYIFGNIMHCNYLKVDDDCYIPIPLENNL